MNKAFTKETDQEDEDVETPDPLPPGLKNYITPEGLSRLNKELNRLWSEERPKLVETVSWAAGNGDRSENGDYIYGKKRLREIDRRVRYLRKRIEIASVVDPRRQTNHEQVFFGATVTYLDSKETEHSIRIVGVDEVRPEEGEISWVAPVARALMKAYIGDRVDVRTPQGIESLEIVEIDYPEA